MARLAGIRRSCAVRSFRAQLHLSTRGRNCAQGGGKEKTSLQEYRSTNDLILQLNELNPRHSLSCHQGAVLRLYQFAVVADAYRLRTTN